MGIRYNPALDGLRAVAVLAVVFHHAHVPGFAGGFLGVDLFFVLSGYLITRSLAADPDLVGFYLRRLRRLGPALGVLLLAYVAWHAVVSPAAPYLRHALLAALYLSDYAVAFHGVPAGLQHTWSLSVEEHFYLLWPLVFLRFRPSVRALLVAYVVATAWRWGWPDWQQAYFRFDTRLSGLLLGCALAFVPRWRVPAWPGIVLLLGLSALLTRGATAQGPGIVLAEAAAALAILGTPPRWLSTPALVYLGRISYGIYLWHYPLAEQFSRQPWPTTLAVALLAIPLAALSYHLLEARVLSRSRRTSPRPAGSACAAPAPET